MHWTWWHHVYSRLNPPLVPGIQQLSSSIAQRCLAMAQQCSWRIVVGRSILIYFEDAFCYYWTIGNWESESLYKVSHYKPTIIGKH